MANDVDTLAMMRTARATAHPTAPAANPANLPGHSTSESDLVRVVSELPEHAHPGGRRTTGTRLDVHADAPPWP
ncbi:hypothetical protein C3488_12980 [Streptomyces sp. Ru72]|nr:hypothetical protein C3488_12980 [Streptomyces sp. Ru72]